MHVVRTGQRRPGPTRPRPRRTLGAATLFALTLLAVPGSGVAAANSLRATASPNAQAGAPMTISATGSATPQAELKVFVQPGGMGCATGAAGKVNADAQSQRIGSVEVISRTPEGPFAYAVPYTPPSAGNYSLCAYLFGPSPATGSSQVSQNFSVAPAPPAPAPPPPAATSPPVAGTSPTGTAATRCVVPKLKGRTYLGARKLLRRAGCSAGTVYRPTRRTPKGYVLRVVWQLPKAESVRRVNSRVTLRLGFVKRRF